MTDEKNNVGTVYDDVYRTLVVDCPSLIIPIVNEVFKKDLERNTKVIPRENESFLSGQDGVNGKRITDSYLQIESSYYHFECQSTVDNTMLIRFFEYDSQLALKNSELDDGILTVHFPNTAVLYLRHNRKTPDTLIIKIKVPEDECLYRIPVMKTSRYMVEEIFEKELYFLIPFHIFAYEADFAEYDSNEEKLIELTKIYEDIMRRLEACAKKGLITEYIKHTIITMSKQVLEKISQKYEQVKKGVGEIMGGKVLEYEAKDILRRGMNLAFIEQIQKKIQKDKSIETIADELELSVERIEALIKEYNLK